MLRPRRSLRFHDPRPRVTTLPRVLARGKGPLGTATNRIRACSTSATRIIPDAGILTYIHIPARAEVIRLIADAGLILVENNLRSELALESEAIRNFSAECRMWVVRRPEACA